MARRLTIPGVSCFKPARQRIHQHAVPVQYNDITNAFKCYRREVIEHMMPLISPHFNLTVEMPLKAIVRGFSYRVTPITWTNRQTGISKLKIKEMGSRYLFIVLYLWLENICRAATIIVRIPYLPTRWPNARRCAEFPLLAPPSMKALVLHCYSNVLNV